MNYVKTNCINLILNGQTEVNFTVIQALSAIRGIRADNHHSYYEKCFAIAKKALVSGTGIILEQAEVTQFQTWFETACAGHSTRRLDAGFSIWAASPERLTIVQFVFLIMMMAAFVDDDITMDKSFQADMNRLYDLEPTALVPDDLRHFAIQVINMLFSVHEKFS